MIRTSDIDRKANKATGAASQVDGVSSGHVGVTLSATELCALEGHFDPEITSMSIKPDGCTLAFALRNGGICFWDIRRALQIAKTLFTDSALFSRKASSRGNWSWLKIFTNEWKTVKERVEDDPYSSAEAIFSKLKIIGNNNSRTKSGQGYSSCDVHSESTLIFFHVDTITNLPLNSGDVDALNTLLSTGDANFHIVLKNRFLK